LARQNALRFQACRTAQARVIYFDVMEGYGPASESLRIAEHYQRLTDDELIAIAQDTSELTELARQALATEISQRKLTIPGPETPPPPPPDTEDDQSKDPYVQDRQVIQIATVWSLSDALQLQSLLDQAEIPFFMGEESATRAEQVTSNFRNGVPVGVMKIGVPWAQQAMQHYEPADEPITDGDQRDEDLAVHCPKCHSEDVIFEHLVEEPGRTPETEKFAWTCASCGNRWEDEGVETES
jgi:DNA-directed RNA polymerase subunit M/transcription elongation factor TFIIS